MRHADHDGSRRAEPAHLWLTGRALAPNGVTERSRRSLPPSDSSVRLAARRVVLQSGVLTGVGLTGTSHGARSLTVMGPSMAIADSVLRVTVASRMSLSAETTVAIEAIHERR
jgi:hypothetical protein